MRNLVIVRATTSASAMDDRHDRFNAADAIEMAIAMVYLTISLLPLRLALPADGSNKASNSKQQWLNARPSF